MTKKVANQINHIITFVINQLLVKGNAHTGYLYNVEFTWSHWVYRKTNLCFVTTLALCSAVK